MSPGQAELHNETLFPKEKKQRLATIYNVIFDRGENVVCMTFMIPTSANIKGHPPRLVHLPLLTQASRVQEDG